MGSRGSKILTPWQKTGLYGLRWRSRIIAYIFFRWWCGSDEQGRAVFYV